MTITLVDLLELIDKALESRTEKIQICSDDDWDEFDELAVGSELLVPFYQYKVNCIWAAGRNTIRVDLDWGSGEKK